MDSDTAVLHENDEESESMSFFTLVSRASWTFWFVCSTVLIVTRL